MSKYGYWWADNSIELVKIDGEIYALYGWNGEKYYNCWKCADMFTVIETNRQFTISPIYKETTDGDFEIVDYIVE